MPLDPILARGTTPLLEGVPNTLYQIAAMREARARDQEFARRTALYEQTAADERKLRLEDRQLALEDREKAERTRRLKEILPLVEAGDPAAISEAINGIKQANPQVGAILEQRVGTEGAGVLLDVLRKAIGEQGPSKITTQNVPGVGTAVLDNGQLHSIDRPPQRAPDRPQLVEVDVGNGFRQRQWLLPGQRFGPPVGKSYKPKAEARPQLVPGPYGEGYLTPTDQGTLRPVPIEGQEGGAGGPIVKVRTAEEAWALPPGTVFQTPDGRVKVRP